MKIVLENINKSFDKKTNVIDNLNLEIKDSKLTTLLGFSGCGKTTLLRIISGLETPNSGVIWFDNDVVFDDENKVCIPPIKRHVAFVFQDFALWPNMTVLNNVCFAIESVVSVKSFDKNPYKAYKFYKSYVRQKAIAALKVVKMEDFIDRSISQLSGGQKQRVAIARAISIDPKVILFDEPFSALDAKLREEMRLEIRKIVDELKITAIFVTHDQDEAMSISDEIIVMSNGKIIEQANPNDIYWHPKTKFVAEFIGKSFWLDENNFLRPENVSLEKEGYDSFIPVIVDFCECKGGYFAITGHNQSYKIYLNNNNKIEVGSEVLVFYNKKNIINICEEE